MYVSRGISTGEEVFYFPFVLMVQSNQRTTDFTFFQSIVVDVLNVN